MANTSLVEKSLNDKDFTRVFTKVEHNCNLNLSNPNHIHIYHLNIENNAFSYEALHRFLLRNVGRYVFSRAKLDQFNIDGDIETISSQAISLLRKSDLQNDKGYGGELGEILLYIFLEQVLGAPKLLSKMELKTSRNMYIYGSDGVHLFSSNNGDCVPFYQLVLGESKIKGDLKAAVDAAFISIRGIIANPINEIRLVENNIFKEAFSPDQVEQIKTIILPEKRGDIQYDKAFGVFLGYTLKLDSIEMSNIQYRKILKEQLIKDIDSIILHILGKINEKDAVGNDLSGFSFYFYILPFNDTKNDRRTIIQKLLGDDITYG